MGQRPLLRWGISAEEAGSRFAGLRTGRSETFRLAHPANSPMHAMGLRSCHSSGIRKPSFPNGAENLKVRSHSDYQKQFLRTAVRLLAVGGAQYRIVLLYQGLGRKRLKTLAINPHGPNALKPAAETWAGEMVYSTCTLTPEENEENVHWALQTLPVELLDAREKAPARTPHLL